MTQKHTMIPTSHQTMQSDVVVSCILSPIFINSESNSWIQTIVSDNDAKTYNDSYIASDNSVCYDCTCLINSPSLSQNIWNMRKYLTEHPVPKHKSTYDGDNKIVRASSYFILSLSKIKQIIPALHHLDLPQISDKSVLSVSHPAYKLSLWECNNTYNIPPRKFDLNLIIVWQQMWNNIATVKPV